MNKKADSIRFFYFFKNWKPVPFLGANNCELNSGGFGRSLHD